MWKISVFALLILASGCITQPPTCNRPYILVGQECCLDVNQDDICDRDLPPTTTSLRQTTSTTESVKTTTLVRQTTTTFRPTTTTTIMPIACGQNSDCGAEKPSGRTCDGNRVANVVEVPQCTFPGTPRAKCEYTRRIMGYERCEGLCFEGGCFPHTCNNRNLEYNEEDVDCGGVCPPCDKTRNKRCFFASECGLTEYKEGYTCHNGNVVRERTAYSCINRTCSSKGEWSIVERCMENSTCVKGERFCIAGAGTCFDCVRNQGEERIDCGGPCRKCAPLPPSNEPFTTHRDITLESLNHVVPYKGVNFRYLRPIINDTCTYGAVIQVRPEGGKARELYLTRYQNGFIGPRAAGFYMANETMAEIWVASSV